MQKRYDVVIVGAGPAGGQLARYLSMNSKLDIVLLDQTQEIGEPKKSTAGTFHDAIEEFELPRSVIMQDVDTVVLEGPTQSTEFPVQGAVLEFGKFKRFLVDEAIKHRCDLAISTHVTHPIVENGRVCGVKYHDWSGEGEVRGKIIVDASGPPAILAKQVGLRYPDPKKHGTGMELEMENLKVKNNNMMLFKLDQRYSPGGYSWIFSTGKNSGKVGVCWAEDYYKKMKGNGAPVAYLHKWIQSDPRLKNAEAVEVHGGDVFTNPKVKKKVTDGLICIGDSVCTVNPFAWEGIRPALKSANFAGETILKALKQDDVSAKMLREYEQKWNKYAYLWKICELSAKKIYHLDNNKLDKHILKAKKLDKNIVSDLLTFKIALKDTMKILKAVL